MPYIDPKQREIVDDAITNLLETLEAFSDDQKAGVLNYTFTKILNDSYTNPNYKSFNEIVGILECAKLEFYRRRTAPYEDYKKEVNGDVFPKTYQ